MAPDAWLETNKVANATRFPTVRSQRLGESRGGCLGKVTQVEHWSTWVTRSGRRWGQRSIVDVPCSSLRGDCGLRPRVSTHTTEE